MLQAGKDFEYFNFLAEVKMHEANLPHWNQERALYFVTFRLADSIPKEKLSQWKCEFEQWLTHNPKPNVEATLLSLSPRNPSQRESDKSVASTIHATSRQRLRVF